MGFPHRRVGARARLSLATAVGCFAIASSVSVSVDGALEAGFATVVAVLGCVPAGLWARRVRRRTHAAVALGLWGLVIAIGAGQVLVGISDVGIPGTRHGWMVLLWTIALGAGVTTVYLGWREYAATGPPSSAEDVLDGGPEY